MKGDDSEKVWSRKEVSYKHLHVFSCRAFAHIHKDDRFKLDGKARQCIFLGYSDEKLSYRIWDLENKKVFRSRDEDQTLEDFKKETVHANGLVDLDLVFSPNSTW